MNSLTISAQHLELEQGGIGRVARLSVKALQHYNKLHALAVEDRRRHSIGSVQIIPFAGNRLRFFLANSWEVLSGRKMLYDFAGTARAPVYKRRSSYAVWIHGYELWNRPVRSDYMSVSKRCGLVQPHSRNDATRPVLASIEDAFREVNLDGATGFNVSRSDRSGIIDRIVCLMKDRELASGLGSAGAERWRKNFRFSRFQKT
jgi:hypothetical protein